jgi:hypothetical protein
MPVRQAKPSVAWRSYLRLRARPALRLCCVSAAHCGLSIERIVLHSLEAPPVVNSIYSTKPLSDSNNPPGSADSIVYLVVIIIFVVTATVVLVRRRESRKIGRPRLKFCLIVKRNADGTHDIGGFKSHRLDDGRILQC